MFSHQVYNVVHIVGIVMLMAALGGAALLAMVDAQRTNPGARRLVAVLHGVGAFVGDDGKRRRQTEKRRKNRNSEEVAARHGGRLRKEAPRNVKRRRGESGIVR